MTSSWLVGWARRENSAGALLLFPGKSMLENAITGPAANEPIESVTQSERSGRTPVLDRILMEHKKADNVHNYTYLHTYTHARAVYLVVNIMRESTACRQCTSGVTGHAVEKAVLWSCARLGR
ncbi:hypothetical protein T03_11933 [Trichinella britovi]|uniref:Uncharacterized protein n=2 Tax=Trichinella TaxID=6333 RepID=A0A0V1D2P5_TRIBR|nr:hypothetical protein T03_11933 [Trichinella britovi]KRZ83973.1 hypothetical protein T08_5509 [Trichinella sp. T8]